MGQVSTKNAQPAPAPAPGELWSNVRAPFVTRLLAILGVLGISFSAVFVRLAEVSPATAGFFRGAYALPVLAAIAQVAARRLERARRRDSRSRIIAFVSGLFLATDLTFWHQSIEHIGAGLATVLANVQVAFVGLLAWLVHGERPTRDALLVIPLMFVGVILIAGVGSDDAYGADPARGAIVGLAAGLAYSGFIFLFRASNRQLSPPALPLFESTLGVTLGSAISGFVFEDGFSLVPTWPAHGWLLALAMVAQVVGWLLIAVALPRLAALETSVMLLLQPLCTVIWGFLLFAEVLSLGQLAGAGTLLAGVSYLSVRGAVSRRGPEAESS